jgi:hypothetical protein
LQAGLDIARKRLQDYDTAHPGGGYDHDMLQKNVDRLIDELRAANAAAAKKHTPAANPLFHKSAFITGEPARNSTYVGFEGIIADGTKTGVLAAFREMMATGDAANAASGGGFTNASFETGGTSVGGFGGAHEAGRRIGNADGSRRPLGHDRPVGDAPVYHDPNAFYDAIISAEGTAKHGNPYDTSLGYTKSPKPLSKMTLAESLQWGDWIRHHTGIGRATNSSAKGAFQIVNTTQRLAMKALGMHMNDLFSEANQQRMASWIARHQGLGAWASMPTHPRQYQQALRALRAGEDLQHRKAIGLEPGSASGTSGSPKPTEGHIRADIHVHGGAHKATVRTRGQIEASLHRWPKMSEFV